MPRLRLCKMRVLKYYVKHKAPFETWKHGKRKYSIIILWGINIYVRHNRKQWKSCSPSCQTYIPTFQTRFPKSGTTYRKQVVTNFEMPNIFHNMDIDTMRHCALVSCTPSQPMILNYTIEIYIWNQVNSITVSYHPTHRHSHTNSWYVYVS